MRRDTLGTHVLPTARDAERLTLEDLVKSDIVFVQVTGCGSFGAGADRPGFDSTAFWAAPP